MKYVDFSIKLSPYHQFCCPLSLIYALSFANVPVSPRFFGEFEPDMLTFSARHFEKPLIPSSTQPTRNLLIPVGRPSFPGYGYKLVRTLHDGLPYMEGRRATD